MKRASRFLADMSIKGIPRFIPLPGRGGSNGCGKSTGDGSDIPPLPSLVAACCHHGLLVSGLLPSSSATTATVVQKAAARQPMEKRKSENGSCHSGYCNGGGGGDAGGGGDGGGAGGGGEGVMASFAAGTRTLVYRQRCTVVDQVSRPGGVTRNVLKSGACAEYAR